MNYDDLTQLKHRDDLGAFLNRHNLTGYGVEVGSLRGDYARTIISKWLGKKLTLIDLWAPQPLHVYKEQQRSDYAECFQECVKLEKAFSPRLNIWKMASPQVAVGFNNSSLDFVYIDANHAYDAVTADLHAWWPKVKGGGLLGGHDYCVDKTWPAFMEVQPAVDVFAKLVHLAVHVTTEGANKSWWLAKPTP